MMSSGKQRLERLLEKILRGPSANLEAMRQSAREIRHLQIKKRAPRFKAVHHARAINFRQDAVLKV